MPDLVQDATYCYRVYLGHQPQDRPARLRPVADVPGPAPRAAGRAVQLRRVRRLGPGQLRQRQPRPGGPAGPAGQDRRPVRRRHRGRRQPLGQPVQLRRPLPHRQQRQRRLRAEVLGRAREVAALLPGGRQPHPEQHLPGQLAPAPGRGHLEGPLPARHPMLPERHPVQGLRQRLVRLRRRRGPVLRPPDSLGRRQRRRGDPVQERLRHPLDPDQRRIQVARGRPGRPRLDAAQVRLLPLPAVQRPEQPDLQRLPPGRRQPGGAAEPQRGRHRLQRPRPPVPAQPQALARWAGQLRDRRWGSGAGLDRQLRLQRDRRLRDRLEGHDQHRRRLRSRPRPDPDRPGPPLPAGQGGRHQGHGHPDQRRRRDLRHHHLPVRRRRRRRPDPARAASPPPPSAPAR